MRSDYNSVDNHDLLDLFSENEKIVPFCPNYGNEKAQVIKLSQSLPAQTVQADFLADLINPKYSFSYLCVSDFNSIAYRAAQEVVSSNNPIYNPLYITSEMQGLGKTHFAQAIALAFKEKAKKENNSNFNVCYVSADSFTQEFVTSIKTNTVENFKYKYRKQIDVLVIDDVDKLSGRYKTQTELIFAYEQLTAANKKIIFTSSQPISKLRGFDSKLLSRFGSGLVVSIFEPRVSEIEKIIVKKAGSINLLLTPEMVRFIAINAKANFVEIEGILVKLLVECSLKNKQLSMELLSDLIAETFVREATKIDLKSIELIVCKNYGLTPEQLKSRSRKQQVAEVRMLVMSLSRKYTKMSHCEIGSYYGKNHNTVIHACDTIESKTSKSPIFKLQLEHVEKQLKDLINQAKDVVI